MYSTRFQLSSVLCWLAPAILLFGCTRPDYLASTETINQYGKLGDAAHQLREEFPNLSFPGFGSENPECGGRLIATFSLRGKQDKKELRRICLRIADVLLDNLNEKRKAPRNSNSNEITLPDLLITLINRKWNGELVSAPDISIVSLTNGNMVFTIMDPSRPEPVAKETETYQEALNAVYQSFSQDPSNGENK